MQQTSINAAIAAFLGSYDGDRASAVATIVQSAKDWANQRKGMQESLFLGFLTLAATGASIDKIRDAGAVIRERVRRDLRQRAGFPEVKPRGAKETGAPDFSTASVYAKLTVDMIEARRANVNAWQAALVKINSGDKPLTVHEDSGFPATVGAARRAIAAYGELVAAEQAHREPSAALEEAKAKLWGPDEQAQAMTRTAALERENHELRDELASLQETLRAMREAQPATA